VATETTRPSSDPKRAAPQGAAAVVESDIVLAGPAQTACSRLGIPERAVKRARARSISSYDTPRHTVVVGELPDGRAVQMNCQVTRPGYVLSVRLVERR
jgi:hypothetical protein